MKQYQNIFKSSKIMCILAEEESFEEAVAIAKSQGYEFDPHLLALSLGEIHDNAICTSFSGQ